MILHGFHYDIVLMKLVVRYVGYFYINVNLSNAKQIL